jgi:hypothetical protein
VVEVVVEVGVGVEVVVEVVVEVGVVVEVEVGVGVWVEVVVGVEVVVVVGVGVEVGVWVEVMSTGSSIYRPKTNEQKRFWPWAKCIKTVRRLDPGAKKYRLKYDVMFGSGKFRRVRHYKGSDGEIRKTVEIEI